MSCPWVKIEQSNLTNLEDIISEEATKNFQAREENKYAEKIDKAPTIEVFNERDIVSTKTEDDWEIVMPTMQSDKGYDGKLMCVGQKYSEPLISFDDYGDTSSDYDIESYSEEDEIVDIQDRFDLEREFDFRPQCVFKRDCKMRTKYVLTTNGVKNKCKLSSKTFNSLDLHLYSEEFRRYKVVCGKKKRPTFTLLGIDQHSWHLICKMIKDQIFVKVDGVIHFDEDAITLRAIRTWTPRSCKCHKSIRPILCWIKVFKTSLKPNNKARVTARQKAEKELANYTKLKAAGLLCPDIIMLREYMTLNWFIKT